MISNVFVDCAHCGRHRRHTARGLCSNCARGSNGCNPTDYERCTWPAELLLAEYDLLRLDGYSRQHAAARLGVTLAALEKALERASREAMAS